MWTKCPPITSDPTFAWLSRDKARRSYREGYLPWTASISDPQIFYSHWLFFTIGFLNRYLNFEISCETAMSSDKQFCNCRQKCKALWETMISFKVSQWKRCAFPQPDLKVNCSCVYSSEGRQRWAIYLNLLWQIPVKSVFYHLWDSLLKSFSTPSATIILKRFYFPISSVALHLSLRFSKPENMIQFPSEKFSTRAIICTPITISIRTLHSRNKQQICDCNIFSRSGC